MDIQQEIRPNDVPGNQARPQPCPAPRGPVGPVKRLIIDTDTASDDAVALLMAFRLPEACVEAVTVVAGNVSLPRALRNALYTAELCGADVPVYPGCAKPLIRSHEDAVSIHGDDGMGNTNYPPPTRTPEKQHAVDALIERFL